MKQKILALMIFLGFNLIGQTENSAPLTREDSINTSIDVNLAQYLPPLAVLIEAAIENSPDIDIVDYQVQLQEYELAAQKKDWSSLFFVGGQYRYGVVSAGEVTTNQTALFPEDLVIGAYLTANVRIPLSYFVGRKDQIRAAKMRVKVTESQKEREEEVVREAVIETYHRLLLLQNLIKITSEAKESSDLILEMSVERFRDGELTLDQLGTNTGLKARYATEYETLKSEFSVIYNRLERLIGMPISKLQNTQ